MSTPASATAGSPFYVRALKRLLGREHPDGLFLLFTVEMWERFSYYGMRALLVPFVVSAVSGLGWSKQAAGILYGWYTGLVYLTPLLGGYLADRVLGTHRSLLIGGSIIAAGHFVLALPSHATFFVGLALIIIGTGFFKSNVSTMVGQLYNQGDRRRDAGFTIFYMGINLGAFIGQIICSYLAENERFGWHWGFGAAGVGMVIGLVAYAFNKPKVLGTVGDVPARRENPAKEKAPDPDDALPPDERQRAVRERVYAIFAMAFFEFFFFLAFEQAGSSMNLFAVERTDRTLGGITIPFGYFQSLNPLIIILFAPLFARMWTSLGARGREPSTPVKFALGLILVGGGFVFMVIGGRLSDGGVKVSPWWLVGAYAFHTWGELCLSPVGLSMVTKLAPAKFASLFMGVWFLATFAANLTGGLIAGMVEKVERGEVFHLLGGQADFFLIFVVTSVSAGLVLLAISPKLKRWMHGRA